MGVLSIYIENYEEFKVSAIRNQKRNKLEKVPDMR